MYCENCGALLTGGGKFCPECGAAVSIKIQNQYKKELEQGNSAFAYLPEEEPAKDVSADSLKSGSFGYNTARRVQEDLDRLERPCGQR